MKAGILCAVLALVQSIMGLADASPSTKATSPSEGVEVDLIGLVVIVVGLIAILLVLAGCTQKDCYHHASEAECRSSAKFTTLEEAAMTAGLKISDAKVIRPDGAPTDVIQSMNCLPTDPGFVPPDPSPVPVPPARNIVDVAAANPELSTLVLLLKAAGRPSAAFREGLLVGALSGPGPVHSSSDPFQTGWTLFAPTNKAFGSLPAGVLDSLLMPKNRGALLKLLTYHVAEGVRHADDFEGGEFTTLEGAVATADRSPNNVFKINTTRVICPDIEASNGVIHIIDGVLNYPSVASPKSDESSPLEFPSCAEHGPAKTPCPRGSVKTRVDTVVHTVVTAAATPCRHPRHVHC